MHLIHGFVAVSGRGAERWLCQPDVDLTRISGSCASFVIGLPGVKEYAFAEESEAGAAIHLAFEHLVDVPSMAAEL